MDKVTLSALKKSIEKWERRAKGKKTDDECPLCDLFRLYVVEDDDGSGEFEFHENRICAGCPVFAKTGEIRCAGSPYDKWIDDESVENAKKELKFLKSLLPRATR